MWIISKNQLTAISNSIREEFEQRACFAITKEIYDLQKDEVERIVCGQTDKIVLYDIGTEEVMMRFIRLSFEHPVLRMKMLPEDIHDILSSEFEGNIKMKKMIDLLNNNDYGI